MKSKNIIFVLIICCVIGIIASVIASTYPDGLEWVAEKLNFLGLGEGKATIDSLMPDYEIPWIKNRFVSGGLAAVIGVAITFFVIYLIGKILVKRK